MEKFGDHIKNASSLEQLLKYCQLNALEQHSEKIKAKRTHWYLKNAFEYVVLKCRPFWSGIKLNERNEHVIMRDYIYLCERRRTFITYFIVCVCKSLFSLPMHVLIQDVYFCIKPSPAMRSTIVNICDNICDMVRNRPDNEFGSLLGVLEITRVVPVHTTDQVAHSYEVNSKHAGDHIHV